MSSCEDVYTFHNRRSDAIQTVPVFAVELAGPIDLSLSWEHSEAGWFTAEECHPRIDFRGVHEGLDRTRAHVTEHPQMPREFQFWPGLGQSDPG